MFEKLKSGFKGLVSKVTTTEFKPENLTPILSDFKMSLCQNDVAYPVADKISDDLEKRLVGVQVKRLDDRKKIVEENLRQVLLEVMLTDIRVDLLKLADEKRKKNEPFILMFVGINGTGKTTTIAKVAQFFSDKRYSVVLAGADTYRAGSIEQSGGTCQTAWLTDHQEQLRRRPRGSRLRRCQPRQGSRNQRRLNRHSGQNAD